jgi:FKBP-type peptidyl-prolyl cis-trans isomerase FkpA
VRRALPAVIALVAIAATACGYPDPYANTGAVANESPNTTVSPSPNVDDCNAGAGLPVVSYPDGLQYIDLKVGTGATAKSGNDIKVQYTGWLHDCTKFDSSRDRGTAPFSVQIGTQAVIAGWDEGIPGMKVGGKRKLTIPSDLAYGPNGRTDPASGATIIPPNEMLIFEIELLSAVPGPTPKPTPTPTPSPSPKASPSPSPSASPST